MAVNRQQNVCNSVSIVLVLCLLSLWATTTSVSQSTRPSEHGLMFEKKDPSAEVSPAMIAFFGHPKVELPEARDVADPIWRSAARAAPADPVQNNGGHSRSALLIAGIVLAVVGVGLLATAVVAYLIHARKSRAWSGSGSLVGLTHWRRELPEARFGAV